MSQFLRLEQKGSDANIDNDIVLSLLKILQIFYGLSISILMQPRDHSHSHDHSDDHDHVHSHRHEQALPAANVRAEHSPVLASVWVRLAAVLALSGLLWLAVAWALINDV